ncbi:class F sortase [Streptomyces sp. NPDC002845]
MSRRKGEPRPWYRTRAYRLARTVAVAVSLVVGGVWWAQDHGSTGAAPTEAAAGATASPGPTRPADNDAERRAGAETSTRAEAGTGAEAGTRAETAPPAPLPRSPAVEISIPYIEVKAPIVKLGLDRERRLDVPPMENPDVVGWYEAGPSPGEQGTAVAVGHLDTESGPAVFESLEELGRGRIVEVRRADGGTAVYTVDTVRTYEKARFPSEEVYGPRGRPELRLITCGGAFDPKTGYDSNIVVFAHLTATRGV